VIALVLSLSAMSRASQGDPPDYRLRSLFDGAHDGDSSSSDEDREGTPTPAARVSVRRSPSPVSAASPNRYSLLGTHAATDPSAVSQGGYAILREISGMSQPSTMRLGLALAATPPHSPLSVAVELPAATPALDDDLDFDGIQRSSPITGTKAERKAAVRKKAGKKRAATVAQQKLQQEQQVAADAAAREQADLDAATSKHAFFDGIIASFAQHQYTLIDFCLYVFDRSNGTASFGYESFFRYPRLVERLLELWTSSNNSETGKGTVVEWCIAFVCREAVKIPLRTEWLCESTLIPSLPYQSYNCTI
jgi:hypothetical protein